MLQETEAISGSDKSSECAPLIAVAGRQPPL